ncbi:MAG TPA: ornithine carbamoyltransferase [Candidatus Nanoarchaeia archaeon]|nr:ornithine carbamoyltransferase [Candidatus Nanoarchaeia archaeon]
MKHLLSEKDLTSNEIKEILERAKDIKKSPKKYKDAAFEKVLLTIFEAPSLRTRLSFETAMIQMGGDSINYQTMFSPWGVGKESIEDTAHTISRYVDLVMIRMHDHQEVVKFAENASIPVINGLTNYSHPCQLLGDLLTIREKKGRLQGLKLAYFGDGNNNVTHSLMMGCAKMGMHISIACPRGRDYEPLPTVVQEARIWAKKTNSSLTITQDPEEAIKSADVVYTDSWMSYRVPKAQLKKRVDIFKTYQVTKKLFDKAPRAIFMHCLPALRGHEVTAEVIDSKRSVVFDQAENRLHAQKAIILKLLK